MAIAGRAMILSSKPASSSWLGARTSWKTGSPPVRRYTPSSTRQCRWMFKLAAEPNHWMSVTAPALAMARLSPAYLSRNPAMTR